MDPINSSTSAATAASSAPDVVGVETTPRPTARTVGAPFSEVLAGSARAFVRTAGAAVRSLPGSPLMAVAIRGGGNLSAQIAPASSALGSAAGPVVPVGNGLLPIGGTGGMSGIGGVGGLGGTSTSPTGTSSGTAADGSAAGTNDPSISSALAQDQEMNLYYLQVQEQVNAQNRTYSALSNVIEVEHNTAKTAIGNIH
jgi:hypothetical protein